jgi:hypothetical protein
LWLGDALTMAAGMFWDVGWSEHVNGTLGAADRREETRRL